jgi:hypothetical protein
VKVLISQNLRKGDHKCICKPAAVRRIAELVSCSSVESRPSIQRAEGHRAGLLEEFAAIETVAEVGSARAGIASSSLGLCRSGMQLPGS